jgi:N-acetylmuramoyl-L-alanine amidase
MREKHVTLDVARRLARYLRRRGCAVRMSRWSDRTLRPPRRARWVRGTRANALVSVHCDAMPGRRRFAGATTYFHRGRGSGRRLARSVHKRLLRAARIRSVGVRPDSTRFPRGFYVLRLARRPAVLVEMGYITHRPTAWRLRSPRFRQRLAEGIGSGVLAYLRGG